MSSLPTEEIKSRLNVEDVISGYIRLQKRGARYVALCPLHNEKTPSFTVSPDRQMWHCFGCGEGGDMFNFVMKMEGVEFPDALRILAKRAGVTLKAQDPKLVSERARLHEICAHTTRFFRDNMKSAAGKKAEAYLIGRGMKASTIEEFQIGWAQDSWDALLNFLMLKGYKPDMIEKAGLALASAKSGRTRYYDRFRGRIMFPIADANGDPIAFTGRYLVPREGEGKYVNSPQTLLYNKSTVLFGIDKTKTQMRKSDMAVLVEGQMDMIGAWQDGVRNVAAVSGTAFTVLQLQLLKRYTKNIVLLFDADLAGDNATQKSIALALSSGFSVRVARIAEEKDPADLAAERPGALAGVIDKAESVMDYYFASAFARYDQNTLEGKKAIGYALLPHIRDIQNRIEQHHWLEKLSTAIETRVAYLEEEMKNIPSSRDTFLPDATGDAADRQAAPEAPRIKTATDKLLEHIMALCYSQKNKKDAKACFGIVKGFDFPALLDSDGETFQEMVSAPTAGVFALFFKHGTIGQFGKDFSSKCAEAGKDVLREVLLASEALSPPDVPREILFCAQRVEKDIIDARLKKLEFALTRAEEEKNTKLSERLFKEVRRVSEKKNQLLKPSVS